MHKHVLGIIDATDQFTGIEELTRSRCLAAVPFGGKYRLIDFPLSNMVNFGIRNIAVFTNNNCRALRDHLGAGKHWDLQRKREGLFIFSPTGNHGTLQENGDLHYYTEHIDYLYKSSQPYVLLAKGNLVAKLDVSEVFVHHQQSRADITHIISNNGSLGMYLLKKELFITILENSSLTQHESFSTLMDANPTNLNISNFYYNKQANLVTSVQSYYKLSLQLLDNTFSRDLFTNPMIRTKEKDDAVSIYKTNARVNNSIIANGCVIDGYVENSILFRGVYIEKGAVIKNSVLLPKVFVSRSAMIENAILDKQVNILPNSNVIGKIEKPLIVSKNQVITSEEDWYEEDGYEEDGYEDPIYSF